MSSSFNFTATEYNAPILRDTTEYGLQFLTERGYRNYTLEIAPVGYEGAERRLAHGRDNGGAYEEGEYVWRVKLDAESWIRDQYRRGKTEEVIAGSYAIMRTC